MRTGTVGQQRSGTAPTLETQRCIHRLRQANKRHRYQPQKKIGAGWVAWGFIWVILLTPWWAWWFPVAFFPIWGWWLSRSSYTWREFSTKYCWILPFAWLPWFGYMLLLYCLDAVSLG